jgi:hypothetical protein
VFINSIWTPCLGLKACLFVIVIAVTVQSALRLEIHQNKKKLFLTSKRFENKKKLLAKKKSKFFPNTLKKVL